MLKKLEDVLNIDNMPVHENDNSDEVLHELAEIEDAITEADNLDAQLANFTGVDSHDGEMDEISKKALETYEELVHLGRNSPVMYSCKVYEVAGQLLKTAMDARDSKLNKKLKLMDMKMKKLKIDQDLRLKSGDEDEESSSSKSLSRNDILELFKNDNPTTDK